MLTALSTEIIRHCALTGYELLELFEDAAVSGGKDETQRPGLAAALAALRDGQASVLVVKHVDRLSRDSDFAGFLKVELSRMRAKLDVIDEVKDDPMRAALDKLLSELERIRGSQRMKFVHRMRRARGLWSGRAPYGFRVANGKLVEVAQEIEVIAQISAMRERGWTMRAIANELSRKKIPAPSAGSWRFQTVSKIVRRGIEQCPEY